MGETTRAQHSGRGSSAHGRRTGLFSAALAALLLCLSLAAPSGPLRAAEYDPKEAGNPIRILAYVVHPVGVVLDYVIMRPAFWVGSHEPFRTLFGRQD